MDIAGYKDSHKWVRTRFEQDLGIPSNPFTPLEGLYEILSELQKLNNGNEKLDGNTELMSQELQKMRKILACWKEKDDD